MDADAQLLAKLLKLATAIDEANHALVTDTQNGIAEAFMRFCAIEASAEENS